MHSHVTLETGEWNIFYMILLTGFTKILPFVKRNDKNKYIICQVKNEHIAGFSYMHLLHTKQK